MYMTETKDSVIPCEATKLSKCLPASTEVTQITVESIAYRETQSIDARVRGITTEIDPLAPVVVEAFLSVYRVEFDTGNVAAISIHRRRCSFDW